MVRQATALGAEEYATMPVQRCMPADAVAALKAAAASSGSVALKEFVAWSEEADPRVCKQRILTSLVQLRGELSSLKSRVERDGESEATRAEVACLLTLAPVLAPLLVSNTLTTLYRRLREALVLLEALDAGKVHALVRQEWEGFVATLDSATESQFIGRLLACSSVLGSLDGVLGLTHNDMVAALPAVLAFTARCSSAAARFAVHLNQEHDEQDGDKDGAANADSEGDSVPPSSGGSGGGLAELQGLLDYLITTLVHMFTMYRKDLAPAWEKLHTMQQDTNNNTEQEQEQEAVEGEDGRVVVMARHLAVIIRHCARIPMLPLQLYTIAKQVVHILLRACEFAVPEPALASYFLAAMESSSTSNSSNNAFDDVIVAARRAVTQLCGMDVVGEYSKLATTSYHGAIAFSSLLSQITSLSSSMLAMTPQGSDAKDGRVFYVVLGEYVVERCRRWHEEGGGEQDNVYVEVLSLWLAHYWPVYCAVHATHGDAAAAAMLEKTNALMQGILDAVWPYWETVSLLKQVRGLVHEWVQLYAMLTHVDLAKHVGNRKWRVSIQDGTSSCAGAAAAHTWHTTLLLPLARRVMDADWTSKCKAPSIEVLLPFWGPSFFSDLFPGTIPEVIETLRFPRCRFSTDTVFRAFMQTLKASTEGPEYIWQAAAMPLLDAFTQPCADADEEDDRTLIRDVLADQLLPSMVGTFPDLLPRMLAHTQENRARAGATNEHLFTHLLMALLRAGREHALIDNVRFGFIPAEAREARKSRKKVHRKKTQQKQQQAEQDKDNTPPPKDEENEVVKANDVIPVVEMALDSSDPHVRMNAFMLLCKSNRHGSEAPSATTLRLGLRFVALNLKSVDKAFIQDLWGTFSPFVLGCINARADILMQGETADEASRQLLDEIDDGLAWLQQYLYGCLFPGLVFDRRMTALRLISIVVVASSRGNAERQQKWEKGTAMPKSLKPNHGVSGTKDTSVQERIQRLALEWMQPSHVQVLLRGLRDEWDPFRSQVYEELTKFPSPLPGWETAESLHQFALETHSLLSKARSREADTGALMMRLLLGKSGQDKSLTLAPHPDHAEEHYLTVTAAAASTDGSKKTTTTSGDSHVHDVGTWTSVLQLLEERVDLYARTFFAADEESMQSLRPVHGFVSALQYLVADLVPRKVMHATTWTEQSAMRWTELLSQAEQLAGRTLELAVQGMPTHHLTKGADFHGPTADEKTPAAQDNDAAAAAEVDAGKEGELLAEAGADDATGLLMDVDIETEDHSSAAVQQLKLACHWLTMRYSCEVLDHIVSRGLQLTWKDAPLLSAATVERIARHLLGIMRTCMHNGVVERAYVALTSVTVSCLKCDSSAISQLPRQWLQGLLEEMASGHRSILRRSSGLCFSIRAIVRAESMVPGYAHASTMLAEAMECALDIASQEEEQPQEQQNGEAGKKVAVWWRPKVHALHVMFSLMREGKVGRRVSAYGSRTFSVALRGYYSPVWNITNSSMMLLVSLLRRLLGPRENLAKFSFCNGCTAESFFGSYPNIRKDMAAELKLALAHQEQQKNTGTTLANIYPTLFPILCCIKELRPASTGKADEYQDLLALILNATGHPALQVRRTLAEAAVALVPLEHMEAHIQQVVTRFASVLQQQQKTSASGWNQLHSVLYQVACMVEAYSDLGAELGNGTAQTTADEDQQEKETSPSSSKTSGIVQPGLFASTACALQPALWVLNAAAENAAVVPHFPATELIRTGQYVVDNLMLLSASQRLQLRKQHTGLDAVLVALARGAHRLVFEAVPSSIEAAHTPLAVARAPLRALALRLTFALAHFMAIESSTATPVPDAYQLPSDFDQYVAAMVEADPDYEVRQEMLRLLSTAAAAAAAAAVAATGTSSESTGTTSPRHGVARELAVGSASSLGYAFIHDTYIRNRALAANTLFALRHDAWDMDEALAGQVWAACVRELQEARDDNLIEGSLRLGALLLAKQQQSSTNDAKEVWTDLAYARAASSSWSIRMAVASSVAVTNILSSDNSNDTTALRVWDLVVMLLQDNDGDVRATMSTGVAEVRSKLAATGCFPSVSQGHEALHDMAALIEAFSLREAVFGRNNGVVYQEHVAKTLAAAPVEECIASQQHQAQRMYTSTEDNDYHEPLVQRQLEMLTAHRMAHSIWSVDGPAQRVQAAVKQAAETITTQASALGSFFTDHVARHSAAALTLDARLFEVLYRVLAAATILRVASPTHAEDMATATAWAATHPAVPPPLQALVAPEVSTAQLAWLIDRR